MISKDDISKFVSILDIADEFDIKLEEIYSGTFTHKCKCPSKNHKNGNETTAACNIDAENNKFWCFVCNAGLSVIDFYMLCTERDFSSAIIELSKRITDGYTSQPFTIGKKNNFQILFDISSLFREAMLTHSDDLKWINEIMKKTEDYILLIDKYDLNKTSLLLEKLKSTLKKRYEKCE